MEHRESHLLGRDEKGRRAVYVLALRGDVLGDV
jgi:hypothetical protein